MSFWSSGAAITWKWDTQGRNFQTIQSLPRKNRWDGSCKQLKCLYGRHCSSGSYFSSRQFLDDIDVVDGSMSGEVVRMSVGKNSNTVQLLRLKSRICYISNINALFKAYHCPSCDQFIKRAYNLEQHLITSKKKELNRFFQIMCINCEKHCLTD